jgi:small-conductance mechanosensitive channel
MLLSWHKQPALLALFILIQLSATGSGLSQDDAIQVKKVAFAEAAAPLPVPNPQTSPAEQSAAKRSGDSPSLLKAPQQSRAEVITRLERAIQADSERLEKAHAELNDPESEYHVAEKAFRECDELLKTKKADLAIASTEANSDLTKQLRLETEELEKKWNLARERFDLSIEKRRTIQEQVAAIEEKLKGNREAAAQERGAIASPQDTATTPTPLSTVAPPEVAPQVDLSATVAMPPASPQAAQAAPATNLAPVSTAPVIGALSSPQEASAKPPSKELQEAQTQVEIKREEALKAEQNALSITERIEALDRDIALESKLAAAAQKKADIAFQTTQALDAEYEKALHDESKRAELIGIWDKRRDSQKLFKESREESRQRSVHLDELQTERAALQRDVLVAKHDLEQKQLEVSGAEGVLTELQNPLSLRNTLQWMIDHLPKIVGIALAMLLIRWFTRLGGRRLIKIMVQRSNRGTAKEREDRARTLVSVFRSALSIAVTIGGLLMIFEEIGISVAPLVGGAAVFGLAIAFGAQNLIRDYFYGFVILIENQYKLNDVLKIGDIAGQVEQITLRMTVLRDAEGNVHFIPNGKIDSVTNMTHGWSRAMIEVSIAYKENADFVMQVLTELAFELKQDPLFGPDMIDDPEMLGVDSLGDSAVTLKLMIKTRTFKQWSVKREMLRRIKRRFDEMGIEIPFPHRVVFHRHAVGDSTNLQHIAGDDNSEQLPSANPKIAA